MSVKKHHQLDITATNNRCPIGETVGNRHLTERNTPVLSCEGACIRGEIARQAANMVAKQPGFGRGCHGELLSVPQSAIAQWIHQADQVILIDGCFLRCHGRMLESVLGKEKLVQFDALSHHKKYSDVFDPDDIPQSERQDVAGDVADWVLETLSSGSKSGEAGVCADKISGCCG